MGALKYFKLKLGKMTWNETMPKVIYRQETCPLQIHVLTRIHGQNSKQGPLGRFIKALQSIAFVSLKRCLDMFPDQW